jgi:ligand-binding sensor domain-containing protein
MYRAPDGRLFVFCFGGLAVYDGAQDRFVPYVPPGSCPRVPSDRTLTLHLDRWGNEWIATEDGVFRRDSQGKWTVSSTMTATRGAWRATTSPVFRGPEGGLDLLRVRGVSI